MKLFYTLFLNICLGLLFINVSNVHSQDHEWHDDPLKKPTIWEKIVKDPTDSSAWEKYMGKGWGAMTTKELEKISLWKQDIMLRRLAENESVVGLVVKENLEDLYIDEQAYKEFNEKIESAKGEASGTTIVSIKDFAGIEAFIHTEAEEVQDLKKNVLENFVIIEDFYEDIFSEYQVSYKRYEEVHPDGKYSKIKWVEDQDAKIKKMKDAQIKKLRERYTVVNDEDVNAGN